MYQTSEETINITGEKFFISDIASYKVESPYYLRNYTNTLHFKFPAMTSLSIKELYYGVKAQNHTSFLIFSILIGDHLLNKTILTRSKAKTDIWELTNKLFEPIIIPHKTIFKIRIEKLPECSFKIKLSGTLYRPKPMSKHYDNI